MEQSARMSLIATATTDTTGKLREWRREDPVDAVNDACLSRHAVKLLRDEASVQIALAMSAPSAIRAAGNRR